ncbi:RdgB/HAM1 family non-canonical purine NTP pyrophosphatase [Paenibacillus sp. GSMTC-2017]|uniref:RdgB/HAM1 family non-canonical purine NTP pyrophosphatase n=1 Tax=Paenibacillus sp. GSMTC-2017 TaxID=2794350 RepID=UPI0018DA258A|nr:RdgB/HAM1 family non-canonical purine NTP pyrophosphatase [Paenibacillus sp. GSMTC-2017]MBH5317196.1 RdgB/HAM1 family non-canonical purine NTP pyrophosphatase [Paenibacillus sp. GSMTC-2017]
MTSVDHSENTIVVATKNSGKVKEFAHALEKLGKRITSLYDYPQIADIVEDGDTFAANARIKAKTTGDILGVPVLADDSGLRVEALGGEPGVYSARYAGEGAADSDNNAKLLKELEQLGTTYSDDKLADGSLLLSKAQFVCALALYDPATGQFVEAEGTVDGLITDKPHGDGGFGYDPLFWLPQLGRGMAELTKDEKGAISHRGEALKVLLSKLENVNE